jgi:magnesium-transporting ATPase (P-type)
MFDLQQPWHQWPAAAVVEHVQSDKDRGLSPAEVASRQEVFGFNELPAEKTKQWWQRLLEQFNSPLIYVLVAAAVVTALLEDYIDSAVISVVVVANAIIGFVQEGRAQKALDAVRGLLSETATVIRDGHRDTVDAASLVPGDLVIVESGDQVPADMRVVWSKNVSVSEAALTGESLPQAKDDTETPSDADLSERHNMLYAGTVVATGIGYGLVVATGKSTELGKIGQMVGDVTDVKTPLTRRLDHFATQVTLFILGVGAVAFVWAVFIQDMDLNDAFLAVVALAVAAIPEGLPAVVTIALAIATRLMASQNALIRRLPAVESLGSVSIICTDKTGTLTRNEMTVVRVLTQQGAYAIAGDGYAPHGDITSEGTTIRATEEPLLVDLARASALCNRATVSPGPDGEWLAQGDPTEAALVALAGKIMSDPSAFRGSCAQRDEIPFESERRFMATLHDVENGNRMILVKGAPERILEMCSTEWDGSPLDAATWHERMEEAAGAGERVLALAHHVNTAADSLGADHEVTGLSLIGMVGVMDPPRAEAKEAIEESHRAGVRVIMITGDHQVTASAIGEQLGLNAANPLTGSEIDTLDDEALATRLTETDIIARAAPEHKLRLVNILQTNGALVAMTGDGVNDAPALKSADVGVAMGRGGTDAARAASDVVLTDDRFETIAVAVRRGRVAFDNIKKSLLFMLPTNLGEAGVIMLAVFGGFVLPVTAGQILWINTVTAITLALALVLERAEVGVMRRGPRPAKEPIVTKALAVRIVFVGLLIVIATFLVFEIELARTNSIETARTAAVAMIVVGELVYLFQARRFVESGFLGQRFLRSPAVVGVAVALVVLQLGFTYLPFMNFLFHSRPLDLWIWGVIVAFGLAQFLAIELEKLLWRRSGLTYF